jgi:hypothetical protein
MSRWKEIPEHLKDRIIIATMPKVKYIDTPVVVETAGEIDMDDIANQMFHQPGKVYKTIQVKIDNLPYIYRPSARSKGIYLTANAFYSQKHYIIRSNIANWCKGIMILWRILSQQIYKFQ